MLYYATGAKDRTAKRITHAIIEHLVPLYAITDIKYAIQTPTPRNAHIKEMPCFEKDSNPTYLISNASLPIPDKFLA